MGSKKVKIGYVYYMGLHMTLCRGPVDELRTIMVGDKEAWTGSATGNVEFKINKPDLFGGEKKEGGIAGTLAVLMGDATQAVHERLARMLGGLVPAFRGVTSVFYDGELCALTVYPKKWAFRVRRTVKGWQGGAAWYPDKCAIWLNGYDIKAMNPAHILYQIYTDATISRGLPPARLDDASFRRAADQLYAEGFGLCLKWSRQDGIDRFAQMVIDHIGAVVYTSRNTGLLTLKLIRGDYTIDTVPAFDPDHGLLGIDEDETTAVSESVNEIIVKYTDPADGKSRSTRIKNNAAIMTSGSVVSQSKDYPGIPTESLAQRVALRDLKASAGGLRKLKIRLNRLGAGLVPGDVFKIAAPSRHIESLILRAGRCEYGEGTDGTVTITAVQDVFGLPGTSWSGIETPGYIPPDVTPRPAPQQILQEAPFRSLVQIMGNADARLMDPTFGYLTALAESPTPLSGGFQIWSKVGAQAYTCANEEEGNFSPVAMLANDLGMTTTAVTFTDGKALEFVETGGAARIDHEIVRVDFIDITAGVMTIARGCCDTVPAPHASGATIWFTEDTGGADETEYISGATVNVKLLTTAPGGILDLAAAQEGALTITGRAGKPYPPGNFKINGLTYPATIPNPPLLLTISWSHRDRLTESDLLIDTTQGNIGPEDGTTYRLRLYGQDGALKKTVTGITDTSYQWMSEGADSGLGIGNVNRQVRVVLDSARDGIYSHQAHDWTVFR